MNNRKFGKVTAKKLFMMTSWPHKEEPDGAWVIREDGIHINEEFCAVSPIDTAFDWTPTYDMDWPGSPDPMEAPLLPIPFTANELAACMLDGIGRDIQENFDRRIGYVLDADALARFSLGEREVRDALSDAYALAAKAQLQVGEFDYDEHHAAYMLRAQLDDVNGEANEREGVFEDGITNQEATHRRERAIASVAGFNAHAQQASAAAKAKWFAWRKAMVRQLLAPELEGGESPALAPDAQAEAAPPHILKISAMLATPVETETPKERGARWLAMLEAEEKREKRGALQRLADSQGVDRSNMSKDIRKARELRDKQKRAGAQPFAQLVRDGKRAN